MNWRNLRKADIQTRRSIVREALPVELRDSLSWTGESAAMIDLADVMTENALGAIPVPLGLAGGFLIDGEERVLPMATEEPSVVAAASFAAGIIARHGGFSTWADDPLMHSYVYLEQCTPGSDKLVTQNYLELGALLAPVLRGMTARGGGFRGIQADYIALTDGSSCLRVCISVDVRDAMGANIVNTCAETLRIPLESLTGGTVLMAILGNAATNHRAGARFSIPVKDLARAGFSGDDMAQRIVRAYILADSDPARGVTHNKGIMNGIDALALATANDTRGIEAAAHAWAARNGVYRSLSRYYVKDEMLFGELEMPMAFGTVGGASSFHPVAGIALAILGNPGAMVLARYAAALGLAQNFAALWALTGEGIQKGHMRLHANRLAFAAGARGARIAQVAEALTQSGEFNIAKAREILGRLQ